MNVPIGKGERIIVIHAETKDGFIHTAAGIFKGKNGSADYHTDMICENFENWVNQNLLPNPPKNSIVVLDNASYHTVQEDRSLTIATKKADIIALLIKHSITVPQNNQIKATLLDVCKKQKPGPTYRIDGILKSNGQETLRLPPYHADLNDIDLI